MPKEKCLDEVVEWLKSVPFFVRGLTYAMREPKEDWPYDRNEDLVVEHAKVREYAASWHLG